MLRDIIHTAESTYLIGTFGVGNNDDIYQNRNTVLLWFKFQLKDPNQPVGLCFNIYGNFGYNIGDYISNFNIEFNCSTSNGYSNIIVHKVGKGIISAEIDNSRLSEDIVGVRLIWLGQRRTSLDLRYKFDKLSSDYRDNVISFKFIQGLNDFTENWQSLPPFLYDGTKIMYSVGLTDPYVTCVNPASENFMLQGEVKDYITPKSIKIPKWISYIHIVDYNGGFNQIWPQIENRSARYIMMTSYQGNLPIRNTVLGTMIANIHANYPDSPDNRRNFTVDGFEGIFEDLLVYDGEDIIYKYYHIEKTEPSSHNINNVILITGTAVKKNFRVYNQKSNIFYSHFLLNNTILFTKGVTINMLRSLKNLAREITRVENKVGAPKILTNVQYYQGVYNYADLYLNVGNSANAKLMFDIFGGYNYFNNTGYMKCISANLNTYNITKCIENCMVNRDFFISIHKKVTDTTVCVRIHATEKHPDTDTNTKYPYIQITNINDYNILELEKIEYGYMDRSKFEVIPMLTGDFSEIWDTRNSNPNPAENDVVYIEDVLNICWPTYNSVKEYNPSNKPDRYFYPSRYYTQQVKKNFKVFSVLLAKNNKSKRIKSSYNNFIKEVA